MTAACLSRASLTLALLFCVALATVSADQPQPVIAPVFIAKAVMMNNGHSFNASIWFDFPNQRARYQYDWLNDADELRSKLDIQRWDVHVPSTSKDGQEYGYCSWLNLCQNITMVYTDDFKGMPPYVELGGFKYVGMEMRRGFHVQHWQYDFRMQQNWWNADYYFAQVDSEKGQYYWPVSYTYEGYDGTSSTEWMEFEAIGYINETVFDVQPQWDCHSPTAGEFECV